MNKPIFHYVRLFLEGLKGKNSFRRTWIYKYYLSFHQKTTKKVNTFEKTFAHRHLIHSLLNIFLSIGIRMNSTADEKKNEDTHEIGGPAENEINNLKLYVLGSIIFLTLLGNFLILFLVSSNILLLAKFRSDYLLQTYS